MNRIAIASPRSLCYSLFAIFETLLVTAVAVIWSVDPRQMPGVYDAAGITSGLSMIGLSTVSWFLRRAAPRLARVGWISVLIGFVAYALLPAVP